MISGQLYRLFAVGSYQYFEGYAIQATAHEIAGHDIIRITRVEKTLVGIITTNLFMFPANRSENFGLKIEPVTHSATVLALVERM
jgi:hypothetical protein